MFFGGIKMTQKEALIFQTPAMEMPWHVSVEKNQVTGLKKNQFYFVNAMFYLTEEEGNNVANFSNTAYNIEIAFYGSCSILKVKVKWFPFLSLFALVLSQH